MTTSPTPDYENIPEPIRRLLEASDDWGVVRELEGGLERLDEHQLDAISDEIKGFRNLEARGKAIELLVPKLPVKEISEWLSDPDSEDLNEDPDFFARVLRSVLPQLDEGNIDQAYEVSRNLNKPEARLILLTGLISYVSDDKKPQITSDLYRLANEVEDPELRATTLVALYPLVPSDLKPDVFQNATRVISGLTMVRQATMFVLLADVVEDDIEKRKIVQEAISVLEIIAPPTDKVNTLLVIAEDLPIEYEETLRNVARNIRDANERARALLHLEPILARKKDEERIKRNQEMNTLDMGSGGIVTSFGGRKVETPEVETEVEPEEHPSEVSSQPEEAVVKEVAEEASPVPAAEPEPERKPGPDEKPLPVAPVATYLHTDQWTIEDTLGYDLYAKAIAKFIKDERTKPPLTVGVLAPWGQGKTSLMRLVEKHLKVEKSNSQTQTHSKDTPPGRTKTTLGDLEKWLRGEPVEPPVKLIYPIVWFNAWKYQSSEQIWAGLADAIITQLVEQLPDDAEREKFWFALQADRLDTKEVKASLRDIVLERFWPKAKWPGILALAGVAVVALAALTSVNTDGRVEAGGLFGAGGGMLAAFAGLFTGLKGLWSAKEETRSEPVDVDTKLGQLVKRPNYEAEKGMFHFVEQDVRKVFELVVDPEKPAVVFIDDLDRCAADRVAEVLEAVNLFLSGDFPQCYFLIGMDAQVAAASMEVAHEKLATKLQEMSGRYGSLGWYFMDKFIQLPFVIPNLEPGQSTAYLSSLFQQSDGVAPDEAEAPDEGAEDRVRNVVKNKGIKATDLAGLIKDDLRKLRTTDQDAFKRVTQEVIEDRAEEFSDDSAEVQQHLLKYVRFLGGNPRAMKRYANLYRFYRLMQWTRELQGLEAASPSALGRWLVVMLRWPQLVRWIQWEGVSQAGGGPTPFEKAMAFESDVASSQSFEDWMSKHMSDQMGHLVGFVDVSMYDFLKQPRRDDESLARAAEVGVW